VIDVAPIGHLRPVHSNYDRAAAIDEARGFLSAHQLAPRAAEILRTLELYG
jgi:hypothetical protein